MPEQGMLQGIAVRSARRAPMQERQQVDVTVEQGIVDDYRGAGLRQVTFLSLQQWRETLQELGVELPWHTRRANLLIEGIDLPEVVGQQLQIGDCLFTIYGETEPCQRMEELQRGLQYALKPDLRAGVWGKVVRGGSLQLGQCVQVLPSAAAITSAPPGVSVLSRSIGRDHS
jgi:MOSC domain-containing protein YiiM